MPRFSSKTRRICESVELFVQCVEHIVFSELRKLFPKFVSHRNRFRDIATVMLSDHVVRV